MPKGRGAWKFIGPKGVVYFEDLGADWCRIVKIETAAKSDKPKWKKVSKSDGDEVPICECMENWATGKACPIHG